MTIRPGLVSTIIAVYNRPALLVEAVDSVLAQTYQPYEIIVVDDGSTDETSDVARSMAERHSDVVRYIRQDNAGHPAAMNTGLQYASGEFIQFLDSDDVISPEKFAKQVAGLRAHPECGISYCYGREYAMGDAWSGRPARRSGDTFTHLFPALLAGKIWPNPAPLFRRDVVDANGPYLTVGAQYDWEYESRAGSRGVRLHHCREFLSDLRGQHQREGRRKGSVSREQLPGLALVHERVLGHARQAGVTAAALDGFSRRLFKVARHCAAAGFESEARRCLELAVGAAATLRSRLPMRGFGAAADRWGWQPAGEWCEQAEQGTVIRAVRAVRWRVPAFLNRWMHRARVARTTIAGHPLWEWPQLLSARWSARASRQRFMP